MTAGTLLLALRERGVAVEAHGDRVRLAPADRVTADELDAIRRAKREVLALCTPNGPAPNDPCQLCHRTAWRWEPAWHDNGRGAWLCTACATRPAPTLPEMYDALTPAERDKLAAESESGDPLAHLVLDAVHCKPEPAAWRLYSRRLDRELWMVRDAEALAELEKDGARDGLPVVLAADLPQLRAFEDQRLRELLDVLAVFPGARLAQFGPEGTA